MGFPAAARAAFCFAFASCLIAALFMPRAAHAQAVLTSAAQRATVRIFAVEGVDLSTIPSRTRKGQRTFALPMGGHGSGALVSADGLILTAKHVVDQARLLAVRVPGSARSYPATTVYEHPSLDFAFLLIRGSFTDVIPLPAKSPVPAIGQPAAAIGYPLDSREELPTQVGGSIAGITAEGLYKLSMALNPGNSGGPVVDDRDRLLGVAFAGADVRKGAQGLGLAVPLDPILRAHADELIRGGRLEDARRRAPAFFDETLADLTASLVLAGAEGLYDEVTRLAAGPTRTALYNRIEEVSRRADHPEVMPIVAAYFWNLAGAVLEQQGALDPVDLPPGSAREHAIKARIIAVDLCMRAAQMDPTLPGRSPFVRFILELPRSQPPAPPPSFGVAQPYGGRADGGDDEEPAPYPRDGKGGYVSGGAILNDPFGAAEADGFLIGGGGVFRVFAVGERKTLEWAGVVGVGGALGAWDKAFVLAAQLDLGMRFRVGAENGVGLTALYSPGLLLAHEEGRFAPGAFRVMLGVFFDDMSLGPSYRQVHGSRRPLHAAELFWEGGY